MQKMMNKQAERVTNGVMKKWYLWLALALLVLWFAIKNIEIVPVELGGTSSNLSDSFAGKYLSARFAERQNNPEKTAYYLAQALKIEPNNLALLERSFAYHIMASKMDEALVLAERYRALSPNSFTANNLLAIAEMRKGNFLGADVFLTSIASNNGDEAPKINALLLPIVRGWVLVGQGRYPDARLLLNAVEVRSELLPFVLYQRALMADVAGNQKDAARIYDMLLKSEAKTSYHLTQAAASFYSRIGRKEDANNILRAFNEKHPRLTIAMPKAPPIASANEGMAEFFLETASLLYSRQMQETAIIYLNLALYLRPEMPYAQFLLASIHEARGTYPLAIRYFEQLHPEDPFYDEAQIAIARGYYRAGEKQKAKDFLQTRLRIKEKDTDALILLADIAVQEKNFDDAYKYYNALLESTATDTPERWTWYFGRGIALERLKQWEKAEPDFLQALELQPDHPEVLNYLAYSWIIENKNIEKAREMLTKALQARPNDAPIIDSYGWALYMLGQHEEAVEYLERANEIMPADPTVNDHLGDVYWKLGRKREARFQWERALSFNPEPEDKIKIKDKLENGLSPREN